MRLHGIYSRLPCRLFEGELEYRKAAFGRLQELKPRMDRAVKRATQMERELVNLRLEEARGMELVDKLKQQQRTLHALQKQEETWAGLPDSGALERMNIGALTQADEAWLDLEYTSNTVKSRETSSPPKSPDIARARKEE